VVVYYGEKHGTGLFPWMKY